MSRNYNTYLGPVQSLAVSTVSSTFLTLRWAAPLYKANSVTEYRVEYRMQSDLLIRNATVTNPGQTSYTVEGLNSGTSYQLRVIPVNSIGDGIPTNINARTGTYVYM